MVEGLLATVVGNMQADGNFLSAMQRLLFPSTFMRFWNYSIESMEVGAEGTCYGYVRHLGPCISQTRDPAPYQSPPRR